MTRFRAVLDTNDDAATPRWFDEHLLRCMKLMPAERRSASLNEFRLAPSEDEGDITLN